MRSPRPRQPRWALVIHRGLRRIAPGAVRARYDTDMQETFGALLDDAASRHTVAVIRLLMHEAHDLLTARRAVPAHAQPMRPERRRAMSFLESLMNVRTLGQSARALVRRPVFSAVAVLTLALGTAATTALFSVVDTVLVKALPYPNADRLVSVMEASRSTSAKVSLVAPVRLEDWNRMNRTFVALSGDYAENVTDTSGRAPERLAALRVTPRFFDVYGATPVLGRTFTSDEERFGGPLAAVVSEGFWTRRFSRDPGILGHSLRIGDAIYPIVGVMPASFTNSAIAVWLPAQLQPGVMALRNNRFLSGIGRMKAGVSVAQAQDDLSRVERELAVTFPATDRDWDASVTDLKTLRIGDHAEGLWLLFGAVGLLWLIALANVAALVLIDMRRRQRELAVRSALGASRGRIIGGVLQEIAIVCGIAALLGAAGSTWIVSVIRATFVTLPRLNELQVDGRALAWLALTSVAAALLCGGVPAWMATRRHAIDVIRGGRSIAGDAPRLQRALVIAQVALSVLLCASAILLARSYQNLTQVDAGFTATGAYTFHVAARWDEDRTVVGTLQARLVETIARQPGVEAVGLTNFLPQLDATLRYQVRVAGLPGTDPGGFYTAGSRTVTAGYLNALRVPLVAGASCPAFQIDPNAPADVLVNRRFIDRFAAGQSVIGRDLRFAQYPQVPQTIVGVIGDVSEDGPAADVVPYVYSCAQPGNWPDPEYVVRLRNPDGFPATLRSIVRQIDPSRAIFGYQSLATAVDASISEPRVDAGLTTLFAVTALGLAGIGLYGLFTLMVSDARREIGVRLALGATPQQMLGLVFAGAGRLLGVGIAIGLALTGGAGHLLRSSLFGVSAHDPRLLALATLTLALVAAVAVALPAARASRVAPTDALKE